MESPVFMNHLLAAAIAVSRRSGALIRDVLKGGNLGTVNKALTEIDPQTEADRRSQMCIVKSLRKRWPDLNIIGEEDNLVDTDEYTVDLQDASESPLEYACPEKWRAIKPSDAVVWVDPLDGTREFTDGFHENVTVLIGIAVGGRPVAGVIHQPFFQSGDGSDAGRSVWGLVGLGTFGFIAPAVRADNRVIATTRTHLSKEVEDAVSAIAPKEHIMIGGAGNKFIRILEGNIDAYIYPRAGTSKWDSCAGEAILSAIGGDLTDRNGDHYDYSADADRGNKLGVVATLGDHESYMRHIRPLFANKA